MVKRGEIIEKNILDDFCIRFCKIVEKYTQYIIVSGFVAIASGRTRATEDIDMIIKKIDRVVFSKMHNDLIRNKFVCVQSDNAGEIFEEYLQNQLSVRYTDKNKPLPEMEVKFAKDSIDEYQLQTRVKLALTGLDIWFSSINMNIAFKEEYLKSPKDMEDARHLRIVYEEIIDEREIQKIKKMISKKRLQ
ncbi:MAG: hypothetical protein Q8L34_05540 [Candidatus Woesearchaeota archaeon]|nr:hypothetical protein [Candidatus Woesearchaeota archaeon]